MEADLIAGLGSAARQEVRQGEVLIELGNDLKQADVDEWARAWYPETYRPGRIGLYTDDVGASPTRAPLAGVEVLIARLASALRCPPAPA